MVNQITVLFLDILEGKRSSFAFNLKEIAMSVLRLVISFFVCKTANYFGLKTELVIDSSACFG